jgi:hypothetical protein
VGQLLHGSARTTAALRRTIQHSQESIARLAQRYDLNVKTVAKWCKRTSVEDAPMGAYLGKNFIIHSILRPDNNSGVREELYFRISDFG